MKSNNKKYIRPVISTLQMILQENVAQFVVSSSTIGENAGEAKKFTMDEDLEEWD